MIRLSYFEVLKNTDNTEIALKSISFIEDEEKERIRSKLLNMESVRRADNDAME